MVKTIKVSYKISEQLTFWVGKTTAEKRVKQTCSDAIKYLLEHRVMVPSEMIVHIEEYIKNKQISYSSKEEFFYESAKRLLTYYNEDSKFIKVNKYICQKAKTAIKDMDLPFISVDDFFETQINLVKNTTNGKNKKKMVKKLEI